MTDRVDAEVGARAERLRAVLAVAAWHSGPGVDPANVLAAIVEELGITPEMVESVREAARWDYTGPLTDADYVRRAAWALSTLLHAAGTRRTPA